MKNKILKKIDMDLRKQFQECQTELDRMAKDLQILEKNPSSFTMYFFFSLQKF